MLKRSLSLLALLVCMIPMLAFAGNVSTRVMTVGGSISTDGGVTTQTASNGTVSKSFATDLTVTITPATGYVISAVTLTGATPGLSSSLYVPLKTTTQAVTVNFAKQLVSVSATTTTGGTVYPYTAQTLQTGTTTSYTFTPAAGNSVVSITGLPAVYSLDHATPYAGAVKATFTVPATPVALVGSFVGVVTNAGVKQTILVGGSATLAATAVPSTGTTYAWTQLSGPSLGVWAPVVAAPVVAFPSTGSYVLQVTATNGALTGSDTVVIAVTTSAAAAARNQCITCHTSAGVGAGVFNNWSSSIHAANTVMCYNCHAGADTGAHPGTPQCATCHNAVTPAVFAATCNSCHGGGDIHAVGSAGITVQSGCLPCHATPGVPATFASHIANDAAGCIGCHSVQVTYNHGGVADNNNGVRAITTEFTKWSHHVTGVTLQNAHCAACHLEGKVVDGQVVVDTTKHMSDAMTHLRNADTDADMAWDPAAPNFTTMDNFCMSCHDANGATSDGSKAIQAVIVPAAGKIASASNPFGDTISNRYDKMQRPAVVDASGQFDPTNNSHHAVKGAKYTGRTRAAGTRQIASAATFAANSSATLYGARSTIYDAGNFNQLYVPLVNAGGEVAPRTGSATLGDDSTLHCGDCHTVGQFKPNSTVNAAGTAVATVIGAHGSNNEYLLRNSIGTDARHTQNAYLTGNGTTVLWPAGVTVPTLAAYNSANSTSLIVGSPIPNGVNLVTNGNGANLVCFNCHVYTKYGSIFGATGAGGGHAGEYAQAGRCNGPGNTLSFNGYTTGAATDGTQFESRFTLPAPTVGQPGYAGYAGEQNPDFGAVYGIQCANCHNSGVENGYGGIHGSKVNTYTDGMGMTNKMIHFLPGLGNAKYVPGTLGGFTGSTLHNYSSATSLKYSVTGDVSNDTNWEQKASKPNQGTPNAPVNSAGAAIQQGTGCYTLSPTATAATFGLKGASVDGGATIPNALGTWGGCEDHGANAGAGDHGTLKKIVRPVTY